MTHSTDFLSKLKPTEPFQQVTAAEIQRKWHLIEQSMESCGAKGRIIQAVPGPRVTRFELEISKADAKKLCKQLGWSVASTIQLVIESRKTNTSYLQRRLEIGYNEACRLMETTETYGIVSSLPDSGSRGILVDTVEEALKRLPWQK